MASSFNLSDLRFFNKEGHSLPLAFTGSIEIVITDKNSNVTSFLGVTDASLHVVDVIKLKSDGRFKESEFIDNKISAAINIPNQSINVQISITRTAINSSSSETLYSINSIDAEEIDNLLNRYILPYPSVSFNSSLQFSPVSTELVETQSLFLGIEYYIEPPAEYTIRVVTTPEDASVMMNGEYTNELTVYEGTSVTIVTTKDGYYTDTRTIIPTSDMTVNIELTAIIYCTIEVATNPIDASCTMNGVGTKTLTVPEHTEVEIVAFLDGYYSVTRTITAESVEHMSIDIELVKIRIDCNMWITYRGGPTAAYYYLSFYDVNRNPVSRDYVDLAINIEVQTYKGRTFTWTTEIYSLTNNEQLSYIRFLPEGLDLDSDDYIIGFPNVTVDTIKETNERTYNFGSHIVQEIFNGYALVINCNTPGHSISFEPNATDQYNFGDSLIAVFPSPYPRYMNMTGQPEGDLVDIMDHALYPYSTTYTVSASGYVSQSNSVTMTDDLHIDVNLVLENAVRSVLAKAALRSKAALMSAPSPTAYGDPIFDYEPGTTIILSPSEYFEVIDPEWADQYEMFFVIDNRKHKEFRIFTIDSDEVIWSDRKEFNFLRDTRIDIGFCSQEEGYYEDILYVCLLDKYDKVDNDDLGKVYPIGSFKLKGESIGEDERYRTLFSNFGIPDPKTYQEVFKNTDQTEGKTDNILLNENSKKMFLSYPEIFPYIGTYKALLNAVEVLGYDDIFFKEWYKEVASNISQKGYVTYDISYEADTYANTINNVPIEERIKLKKLNWLSMIYKINEELVDLPVDMYGFPLTRNIDTYNDIDMIVKLISLKNWLEKYIIGLNCRIIDVGGEGIVFERYLLNTYGSIQKQNSYDSVKNLYGYAGIDLEDYKNSVLDSSSYAQIGFQIGDDSKRIKISDLKYLKYIDLCNGYFDSSCIYHALQPETIDASTVLAGGTYQFVDPFDLYYAKASHNDDKFSFSSLGVGAVTGSKLRIEDNTIKISPYDLYDEDSSLSDCTVFKNLPIIQIERGNIRSMTRPWDKGLIYKIYPDTNTDDDISYIIEDIQHFTYNTVREYLTLIPGNWTENNDTIQITPFKSDSSILEVKKYLINSDSEFNAEEGGEHFYETDYTYGFRYSSFNSLSLPMFSILGYTAEDVSTFANDTEMILEILDGKLLFRDDENRRSIYINFYYDNNSKNQQIDVNIVYDNVAIDVTKYLTNIYTYEDNLFDGKQYEYFIERYDAADENCIRYDLNHLLDVHASGEYTIDLTGKDAHNNLYSVRTKGTAETFSPEVKLTIYSNDESDEIVEDVTSLNEEYSEFCIYDQTQRISGIDVSYYNLYKTDSSLTITYSNYSYALETPSTEDYLHLMNVADSFQASGITKKVSSFPSFSTDVMNSYWIALNRTNTTHVNQYMDWSKKDYIRNFIKTNTKTSDDSSGWFEMNPLFTVDSFLENISDNEDFNSFDVNVVFYNNLGGFPELQTYGWMIGCYELPEEYFTDASRYTNPEEFRLYLPDRSSNSFVWAEVRDAARQDVRVKISQTALDILSEDASYGNDLENISKVIGNTTEYLLRVCEDINDNNAWNTLVSNMYANVNGQTPESFDNATYRYNGYNITHNDKNYNPYNVLRYNFSLHKNPEATDILRQNLLSLGDTSEFLNEIKLFLSNSNNNAHISALEFIDTYMEMFYTDNSLLEASLEVAIELTKIAEWNTDISQNLEIYYKMLYDLMFIESPLILTAEQYILTGIPSGEEGSRIMVDNTNRELVIEQGARETLQNVINEIINNYIRAYPDYQTNILQDRYKNSFVAIIYTVYKYAMLVYFSYLVSRGDILQYPVYSIVDLNNNPAVIPGVDEVLRQAEEDETIDAVDIPDTEHNVMAEILLARLTAQGATDASLYFTVMGYNPSVEVWYPVEFNGDETNVAQASIVRRVSNEYENIEWDPGSMQFPLNYVSDTSLDNASYQLTQYAYGSIMACIPQLQPGAAAVFIATIKGLYEYHTTCDYPGDTPIEKYIAREILQDDRWLTISNQDTSYYAVATSTGDYAKTGDYAYDGLSVGGSLLPIVPDVYQYLNNPKYSIFIQPIWKQEVQVGVLTEFSEEYSIHSGVPIDDPNEKYIYVQFSNNTFNGMFKIGEIVRLSFYRNINESSKQFESACSYRVVGYDYLGQILVLKGYINESQFSEMYNPIYASLDHAAVEPTVQEAIELARNNQTINILNIPYTKQDGKESTFEMGLARLNPDNLADLYYTPVYYDAEDDIYRQMESAARADSQFTIYISYAHHTFVDYVVKAESAIENYNGTSEIDIEYTRRSGHVMQFVDDTFVLDIKDFDTSRAYKFWDTGVIRDDIKEPSITDTSVYKHQIPLEISLGQNIALELSLKNIDMNNSNNEYTSYWKVYKSNNLSDNPTYEFTSYNKILYLRGFEKGYYDIEGFVYDKYGNTSSKYFKNAIIVK